MHMNKLNKLITKPSRESTIVRAYIFYSFIVLKYKTTIGRSFCFLKI